MDGDVNKVLAETEIFALYSGVGGSVDRIFQLHWEQNLFLSSLQILWTLLNPTLNTYEEDLSPFDQKRVKKSTLLILEDTYPELFFFSEKSSAGLDATGHRWEKGKDNAHVSPE